MARAELEAFMREHGITVAAEFVPWTKSRSYDPAKMRVTNRNLNWRVTVKKGDREILTTDYSAGIAHAPSYKTHSLGGGLTVDVAEAVTFETEHGKRACQSGIGPIGGRAILPDPCDVLYSLGSDADVIDCGTFEEWAGNLGYDLDSRKAEATYRACLEIALKLRNGLGEAGLAALQAAGEDY